jgi:hypothetical protein
MRLICYFLSALFLFSACNKEITEMPVLSQAEVLVPLAHGSFKLGELLNQLSNDSLFANNEHGELSLSYLNNPLFSLPFDQFFTQQNSLDLGSASEELGPISLKVKAHQQYIDLQEIIIRLSFIPEISTIPEGKTENFKGITIDSLLAPFLMWPVSGFESFSSATVESGQLQVKLRNDFPVAMQATLVFIDSSMTMLGEFPVGMKDAIGLRPAETDSGLIDLAGKTIRSPLYFYIKNATFFPSDTSIVLEFAKGFEVIVNASEVKLNKGSFQPGSFNYTTDMKRVKAEPVASLKLYTAGISSGKLRVEVSKAFAPDVFMHIYFPCLTQNGRPLQKSIVLTGSSTQSMDIDLVGMELDLSPSAGDYNVLEYSLGFSNDEHEAIVMQAEDQFSYSVMIENLSLERFVGNFGQATYQIDQRVSPLHAELWNMLGKNAISPETRLKLIFNNPMGVPANSQLQFSAYNHAGHEERLSTGWFSLIHPEKAGLSDIVTTMELTTNNSNLSRFLRLPPSDSLNVQFEISTNPNGNPSASSPNFINLKDSLSVGFQLELPLRVQDTLFHYLDTFVLGMLNIPDTEALVALICKSHNDMPLDAGLEITPYDTLQHSETGSPWLMNLLEATMTSELNEIQESVNRLELQPEQIQALREANALLVKVTFSKAPEVNEAVMLMQDMGFDLKIWLNVISHAAR